MLDEDEQDDEEELSGVAPPSAAVPDAVAPGKEKFGEGFWPSRGSVGHPHQCQDGCKYIRRPKGCKDGADCDHCHLCEWKRSSGNRGCTRRRPQLRRS